MGITGLLPLLSPITRPRHIRELSGLRGGIDGHVWLHRSVFLNARAFAIGKTVDNHVKYFGKKCQYLLDNGIHPVFIFDGAAVPAKVVTKYTRALERATSMARAIGLQEAGNARSAYNEYAKATEIKHQMVNDIASSLRRMGAEVHVAPYEADAQLSYLSKVGIIDFAVTEDSDLLVYGCKRVLFKFDYETGYGMEIASPIFQAPAFSHLCRDSTVLACVLAGCDYVPAVSGMSLRRGIEIAGVCKSYVSQTRILPGKVLDAMALRGIKPDNSNAFTEAMKMALLVFKHQVIFDPTEGTARHLNPIEDHLTLSHTQTRLLGELHSPATAEGIYWNSLHPTTLAHLGVEKSMVSVCEATMKSSRNSHNAVFSPVGL